MPIQIGARPESGFDNPLGLMSDCHRRIEKFLDQLLAITLQGEGGSLTPSQRETLDRALRYFANGAPMHTQDEEASLFPRLRDVGSSKARAALKALEALEADHRQADAAHAEVDTLGRRWLAQGCLTEEDSERLLTLLRELRATYHRHIAIEDNQVFPLAGRLLESSAIEAVGREMAARRGLDYDNLPLVSRCTERRLFREAGKPEEITR